MEDKIFDVRDLGLDLTLAGLVVSVIGTLYNNILLDHLTAMLIWRWSNILFATYFIGRWKCWWDGRVSDGLMAILYISYIITNELGLSKYGY